MNKDIYHRIGRCIKNSYKKLRGEKAIKILNKKDVSNIILPEGDEVIVTLTAIPSRLTGLVYVIKSIFLQTMLPNKIIVYFGNDVKINHIPVELMNYTKRGLEFRFKDENFKSHKKYIYALAEFKNSLIITIDDDLIYPEDLISKLYLTHKEFQNCIIASRAHKITFSNKGKINKYDDFVYECKDSCIESFLYLATSGAGCLFPPNAIQECFLDWDLISSFSEGADDIWLKFAEIASGTKCVICEHSPWKHTIEIPNTQENSLNYYNVEKKRNDEYLEKCIRYFGFTQSDFE